MDSRQTFHQLITSYPPLMRGTSLSAGREEGSTGKKNYKFAPFSHLQITNLPLFLRNLYLFVIDNKNREILSLTLLTIFISQKGRQEVLKKWQNKNVLGSYCYIIRNFHSVVLFSTYPKEKGEALLVE